MNGWLPNEALKTRGYLDGYRPGGNAKHNATRRLRPQNIHSTQQHHRAIVADLDLTAYSCHLQLCCFGKNLASGWQLDDIITSSMREDLLWRTIALTHFLSSTEVIRPKREALITRVAWTRHTTPNRLR